MQMTIVPAMLEDTEINEVKKSRTSKQAWAEASLSFNKFHVCLQRLHAQPISSPSEQLDDCSETNISGRESLTSFDICTTLDPITASRSLGSSSQQYNSNFIPQDPRNDFRRTPMLFLGIVQPKRLEIVGTRSDC
jgi:hypothetical protein